MFCIFFYFKFGYFKKVITICYRLVIHVPIMFCIYPSREFFLKKWVQFWVFCFINKFILNVKILYLFQARNHPKPNSMQSIYLSYFPVISFQSSFTCSVGFCKILVGRWLSIKPPFTITF